MTVTTLTCNGKPVEVAKRHLMQLDLFCQEPTLVREGYTIKSHVTNSEFEQFTDWIENGKNSKIEVEDGNWLAFSKLCMEFGYGSGEDTKLCELFRTCVRRFRKEELYQTVAVMLGMEPTVDLDALRSAGFEKWSDVEVNDFILLHWLFDLVVNVDFRLNVKEEVLNIPIAELVGLFKERADLLRKGSYDVCSDVDSSSLRAFIGFVNDDGKTDLRILDEANYTGIAELCGEFGYKALDDEILRFCIKYIGRESLCEGVSRMLHVAGTKSPEVLLEYKDMKMDGLVRGLFNLAANVEVRLDCNGDSLDVPVGVLLELGLFKDEIALLKKNSYKVCSDVDVSDVELFIDLVTGNEKETEIDELNWLTFAELCVEFEYTKLDDELLQMCITSALVSDDLRRAVSRMINIHETDDPEVLREYDSTHLYGLLAWLYRIAASVDFELVLNELKYVVPIEKIFRCSLFQEKIDLAKKCSYNIQCAVSGDTVKRFIRVAMTNDSHDAAETHASWKELANVVIELGSKDHWSYMLRQYLLCFEPGIPDPLVLNMLCIESIHETGLEWLNGSENERKCAGLLFKIVPDIKFPLIKGEDECDVSIGTLCDFKLFKDKPSLLKEDCYKITSDVTIDSLRRFLALCPRVSSQSGTYSYVAEMKQDDSDHWLSFAKLCNELGCHEIREKLVDAYVANLEMAERIGMLPEELRQGSNDPRKLCELHLASLFRGSVEMRKRAIVFFKIVADVHFELRYNNKRESYMVRVGALMKLELFQQNVWLFSESMYLVDCVLDKKVFELFFSMLLSMDAVSDDIQDVDCLPLVRLCREFKYNGMDDRLARACIKNNKNTKLTDAVLGLFEVPLDDPEALCEKGLRWLTESKGEVGKMLGAKATVLFKKAHELNFRLGTLEYALCLKAGFVLKDDGELWSRVSQEMETYVLNEGGNMEMRHCEELGKLKTFPDAYYLYGLCCLNGKNLPRGEAVRVFRAVYKYANHCDAGYEYACCLREGKACNADPTTAANIFKELAGKSHERSILEYALCLFYGIGVKKNTCEAKGYYERLCDKIRSAANGYALCLEEEGDRRAVEYYKKAAEEKGFADDTVKKDANSMCNYAMCLEDEWEMLPNRRANDDRYKKFTSLYKDAAAMGHVDANMCLGWCFFQYAEDPEAAVNCFKFGATQGHVGGHLSYSLFIREGKGIKVNMSEACKHLKMSTTADKVYYGVRSSAFTFARYYERGAKLCKDNDCLLRYGICLLKGIGVKKSDEQAAECFRAASSERHDAMFQYSMCLRNGIGVEQDKSEGIRMLELAANNGHPEAQYRMAEHYDLTDKKKALEYYRKSADNRYSAAQFTYATRLHLGIGVEKYPAGAALYYQLAADNGDPRGQNMYGVCLEDGFGVAKNRLSSSVYYKKAADNGNPGGMCNYAMCLEDEVGLKEFKEDHRKKHEHKEPTNQYIVEEIERLYREAADKRHYAAMCCYGWSVLTRCFLEEHAAAKSLEKTTRHSEKSITEMCNGNGTDQKTSDRMISDRAVWEQLRAGYMDKFDRLSEAIKNWKEWKTVMEQGSQRREHVVDEFFRKAKNYIGKLCVSMVTGENVDDSDAESRYDITEGVENGTQVGKIAATGVWYFRKAAQQGYKNGEFLYATCLQHGIGVEIDLEKSADIYRSAAEKGHLQAQFCYAILLHNGIGVNVDLRQAAHYCKEAADSGHRMAQCEYARYLLCGLGVEVDRSGAEGYYKLAADSEKQMHDNNESQKAAVRVLSPIDSHITIPHKLGSGMGRYGTIRLDGAVRADRADEIEQARKSLKQAYDDGNELGGEYYGLSLDLTKFGGT